MASLVSAAFASLVMAPRGNPITQQGVTPVSYTHLDVYKRQIECSIYIDYIISPSADFDGQLLEKGFRQEQIRHLGIPVQPKFSEIIDKTEARNALGISRDRFTIMIMNGGVGFGDNLGLVRYIMEAKQDFQLVVVNGRNEKMKEAIDEYIAENNVKNILNLG